MLPVAKAFWLDEDGLTTVEYSLLLMLIFVVGVAAWGSFGGSIGATASDVSAKLDQAATSASRG